MEVVGMVEEETEEEAMAEARVEEARVVAMAAAARVEVTAEVDSAVVTEEAVTVPRALHSPSEDRSRTPHSRCR
jgi:uncharacterized protein with PIN domain